METFASQDTSKKHTLVFIPVHLDKASLESSVTPHMISMGKEVLRIAPDSIVQMDQTSWKVPSNMEIVVLQEEGVARLLIPFNRDLLKRGCKNIEAFLHGLSKTTHK